MEIFEILLVKILPLYLFIVLGYIAGRYLHVDKKSVAAVVIYLVAPIVIFDGALNAPLDKPAVTFAIFIFVISSAVCALGYYYGRLVFGDTRSNAFAVAVSNGNLGSFGLPVALLLFDRETVGIYILALFGATVFLYTLCYYLIARGKSGMRDALIQLLRLPIIYAFIIGIAGNIMRLEIPEIFTAGIEPVTGTFTVLGMMIVGMAISKIDSWRFDYRFLLSSLGFRIILWPLLAFLFIVTDRNYLGWFDERVYKVFILISIMPFAFTPIIFATLFNLHPKLIARSVLVSTLLSLLYLPPVISLLLID